MNYKPYPTCFWADDAFLSLSFEQKALFNYLHIGPYGSQCGIFKLPIKTMGFHLGYTERPIEKAMIGLCAAFSDFVAWDQETGEIALLQYPKQLHLSAGPKVLAIVEKDLQDVKSQTLLRLLIEKNSSTMSKPYLTKLRQLQAQKINEKKANCEKKFDVLEEPQNDGDLHNLGDNQEFEEKPKETKRKEKEMQGNSDFSFSLESEILELKLELENQAPQVNAKTLEGEQEPHIKENNICSDGLKEADYKQALMSLLKKFAKEYWGRPDIDTFLKYCWVEGKKFEVKKYGMKKTVPGLLELLKTHFEGEIGEMNKKKAEVSADHSDAERLAKDMIAYCRREWKTEYMTYERRCVERPGYIEEETEALKKLLIKVGKDKIRLIAHSFCGNVNEVMDMRWTKTAEFFKETFEKAEWAYNYYSENMIPSIDGWVKKKPQ